MKNSADTNPEEDESKVIHPSSRFKMVGGGILTILLASIGLVIALYLSYLHLTLLLGEIETLLLCGGDDEFGCHTVAASPYSYFLNIPISVWGACFYIWIIIMALGGMIFWQNVGTTYYRWAFYFICLGLVFDVYLGFIMFTKIQAICRLCISTYIVNVGLFLTLWVVTWKSAKPKSSLLSVFPGMGPRNGLPSHSYYQSVVKGLLIGGFFIPLLIFCGSAQVLTRVLTSKDEKSIQKFREKYAEQEVKVITGEGRPALGTDNPQVTVVEFSDFRCPYCRKTAKYIEIIAASYRDSTRFEFRHMPLDSTCNRYVRKNLHPGACDLAAGAACAHEQGKFWEFHDITFHTEGTVSKELLDSIAKESGLDLSAFHECLDSGRGIDIVRQDIDEALKLGVSSTPTLFINGRVLRGGVRKPWILERIIEHAREHP